jgi:hypothetical protein
MDFLNSQNFSDKNNKNKFNTNYNYNSEKKNNFIENKNIISNNDNNKRNCLNFNYNNNINLNNYNKSQTDDYKMSLNKYYNHKNMTYQYSEFNKKKDIIFNNISNDKNVNIYDNNNKINNRLKNIAEKINSALSNRTIKKENKNNNENNINNDNTLKNMNNSNYQVNIKKINLNNPNNNSIAKNKSFCYNEGFDSYRGGNTELESKYFLKSVFDQNSVEKFKNGFNTFSSSKANKQYDFNDYFFYKNKNNKEEQLNKTPLHFFNIQKNENKLDQMLKSIPRHDKEKKRYRYNNYSDVKKSDIGERSNNLFANNKNNFNINNIIKSNNVIYNFSQSSNNKVLNEDIDSIMPPNVFIN